VIGQERGQARHSPPFAARRLLLPLVIGAIQLGGTYFATWHHSGAREFDAPAAALLIAGPAALVMRRRYPALVLAFVLATTLAYFLLNYPRGPIFLALIVAFIGAVMRGRRVAAIASLCVGYFSFLWLGYLAGTQPSPTWGEALGLGAWLLLLATFAETIRSRRDRAMQSGRARAEEARRRASEERLRIARELHDVLAHNISLMNVQAGVALHLIDDQPEQARTALTAIKEASNEALTELRSVLDVLRQRDESAPRSPAPGLRDIDELIARSEGAGVEITTRIEGTPRPLPAKTDLAAYRIIQEALTNVRRHAGPAHVTVAIGYGPTDLTLDVHDDGAGAGAPPASGGDGIPGMRERAVALGGELSAGPRAGGGFRVAAALPVPGPEQGEPP
jgi:signal transduction histidine kinase